jgi:hypothetical protein
MVDLSSGCAQAAQEWIFPVAGGNNLVLHHGRRGAQVQKIHPLVGSTSVDQVE